MDVSLISTLKNLNTNEIEINKTIARKEKNKITYQINDFKYILKISPNILILNRNNQELECTMYFKLKKRTFTTYTLKQGEYNLEIEIETTFLSMTDKKIEIHYKVIDSNINYEYHIEMSEKK